MLLIEKDRYKKGKHAKKREFAKEEEKKISVSLSFSKKLCHPPTPPHPSSVRIVDYN
jgi:hypothetical protein